MTMFIQQPKANVRPFDRRACASYSYRPTERGDFGYFIDRYFYGYKRRSYLQGIGHPALSGGDKILITINKRMMKMITTACLLLWGLVATGAVITVVDVVCNNLHNIFINIIYIL